MSSMVRYQLEIIHHDGREETRPLENGAWTIGRAADNWLCPIDPTLSRAHARLTLDSDGVWIEPLASHNGTYVNRRRIHQRSQLGIGDEVLFGRTLVLITIADHRRSTVRNQPTEALGAAHGASLVFESAAMEHVVQTVDRIARSDLPVLITGESGTGKELIARRIHRLSPRSDGPFEVLNCPALPLSVLESELFGVEAGVATGVTARTGRIEQAGGGTLLLDEIGDLCPEAQAKLLRFLQEKTIERVGGRSPIRVDCRILAATNTDLEAPIANGSFRADLYYRIAAVTLEVPPLRQRPDDIDALVAWRLEQLGRAELTLDKTARSALIAHPLPGNVRQLLAMVERATVLAAGDQITSGDLGLDTPVEPGVSHHELWAPNVLSSVRGGEADFWEAVYEPFMARELPRSVVRELIRRALADSGGSIRALADTLGVPDRYRKLLDFLRNNELLPDAPTESPDSASPGDRHDPP
jgi:transcriptional regulator with GAF, ATPase, and Fis domain